MTSEGTLVWFGTLCTCDKIQQNIRTGGVGVVTSTVALLSLSLFEVVLGSMSDTLSSPCRSSAASFLDRDSSSSSLFVLSDFSLSSHHLTLSH